MWQVRKLLIALAPAILSALLVSTPVVLSLAPQVAEAAYKCDGTNDRLINDADPFSSGPNSGGYASTGFSMGLWLYLPNHPAAAQGIWGAGNSNSSNNDSQRISASATDNTFRALTTASDASSASGDRVQNIDATWTGLVGKWTSTTSRSIYVGDLANVDTNTTSKTVADVIKYLHACENMAGSQDFGAANPNEAWIAYLAVWNSTLADADITAFMSGNKPTFTSAPAHGTITSTTIPVTFTSDQTGTVYGVACPNGNIGTLAQTEAGNCTGDVAATSAWSEAVVATVADGHTFTGLSASTTYDLGFSIVGQGIAAIDPTHLIAYYPLTASNATQSNLGVDAGGDLAVTGATFDGSNEPVGPNGHIAARADLADQATTSGTPTITSVSADDVLTATETNFSVVGTGFEAAKGTGSLVIQDTTPTAKTITCSSWADTLLSGCDVSGIGMGVVNGLKYGALTAKVTNNSGGSGTRAITVNAPSGTKYKDLVTVVPLSFDIYGNPIRPYGYPNDLEDAGQLAVRNASGCTIASDVTINDDGSLVLAAACDSVDADFTTSSLFGGTVASQTFTGPPPSRGSSVASAYTYYVDAATTPLVTTGFFQAGEAAISSYSWKQATTSTNRTLLNGAVTDALVLVVDSLTGLSVNDYIMCGTDGPVRIKYTNPFNLSVGLWDPLTCADNAQIAERTIGAGALSGLSFSAGSLTGTPDTVDETTELFFRATDADSLFGDTELFSINVVSSVSAATESKVIYQLSDVSSLTKWVDYIPVAVVPGCAAGRTDEDGCWSVTVLSSTSGKVAWVDYTPVYEVTATANKWRYENDGWIPVNTLTP